MQQIYRGNHIPKEQRKTILFIADDFRFPSGVANQARKIIYSTCHVFNFVVIGAGVNHPDAGKIIDASEFFIKQSGVSDASVLLFPYNGYGDLSVFRYIQKNYKPDALLHFTDPRFYEWLYNAEIEIRESMPIIYYALWDCPPAPLYNKNFYAVCDTIISISKQSHALHKKVLDTYRKENTVSFRYPLLKYTPHAIDKEVFRPLNDNETKKLREQITKQLGISNLEFLVFWNNRNANRKQPGDVIKAFDYFYRRVVREYPQYKNEIAMIMHTEDVSNHGTDLRAVIKDLSVSPIFIDIEKYENEEKLNEFYNMADVTLNMASNEGFGLSGAESIMAGTPIINNVTGGLQDQCGFKTTDGKYLDLDIYETLETNSNGTFKDHGEWAFPSFPRGRNLIGSPLTPYIYEEKPDVENITNQLWNAFTDRKNLKARGLKGREFALTEAGFNLESFGDDFIKNINDTINLYNNGEKNLSYQTIKL